MWRGYSTIRSAEASEKDSRPWVSPTNRSHFYKNLSYTLSGCSRIIRPENLLQAGTLILKKDAMNVYCLLFTHLRKICRRFTSHGLGVLLIVVDAAITYPHLTLTALGCGLNGPALVKHTIKCMFRLLGNGRLYAEHIALYPVGTDDRTSDEGSVIG